MQFFQIDGPIAILVKFIESFFNFSLLNLLIRLDKFLYTIKERFDSLTCFNWQENNIVNYKFLEISQQVVGCTSVVFLIILL